MLNYNQALPEEKSYQDLQMKEVKPIMKLIIRGKTKSWIDVYVMNRLGTIQEGKPVLQWQE